MRALTASAVLELWSAGREGGTTAHALGLLAAAGSGTEEELQELPLGEINQRLLELRSRLLSRPFECRTACPGCGEELEAAIDADDLRSQARPALPGSATAGDLEADLRPVTAGDLLAVSTAGSPGLAALALAERCVERLERSGEAVEVGDLDAAELGDLASLIAGCDPAAEVLLDLACAGCGHTFREPLDILSFFVAELDVLARDLFAEVHLLARAYGWREDEVLALPPSRRAIYVDLIANEGVA